MAEANRIIPGIIIGLAVAFGGQAFKSYMERAPTLSADVMATIYAPPVGQIPSNASCLLSINVENNTPRPQRQIHVIADYAVAYSLAPARRASITTGSVAKEPQPYVIDVLHPGASRRVFVFTTWNCDYVEFGHPGMRVFNDEGSASIRTIVPPTGWMVYVNEHHFISVPLMGLGSLLVLLIVVSGVMEAWAKLSGATPPKPPEPPPAAV